MAQSNNSIPVLVTGGAGYIGSHVVWALSDAGYRVVVLDDLSSGRREALPASARLIVGDVGNPSLVESLIRDNAIGAVMHFAGSVLVAQSVEDPLGYYANNTLKSHALITASIAAGVKSFIFSSTAAVYGAPVVQPIMESAPTAPINPYGASKLMTEIMLRDAAAASGLNYVILRYFNVAGADPAGRTGERRPTATHLINVATQVALGRRRVLSIFGEDYDTPDGTCIRDYIHVSDLADAHVRALGHLARGGASQTLNCGYGRGVSVREVIDKIGEISGWRVPTQSAPRRPGDPPVLVAAVDRLRSVLDWRPRHDDLGVIIGTALAWEQHLTGINPHRATA
ncbi:MAG: UDP-glucose 4-epimerase [Aliidongia sp.]|nr:UDP-glucose 4-epimerase [Aliidongia sp.]